VDELLDAFLIVKKFPFNFRIFCSKLLLSASQLLHVTNCLSDKNHRIMTCCE